jgi:hypothetical protein
VNSKVCEDGLQSLKSGNVLTPHGSGRAHAHKSTGGGKRRKRHSSNPACDYRRAVATAGKCLKCARGPPAVLLLGVILSAAVLQAERRACPERSRRDLARIATAFQEAASTTLAAQNSRALASRTLRLKILSGKVCQGFTKLHHYFHHPQAHSPVPHCYNQKLRSCPRSD